MKEFAMKTLSTMTFALALSAMATWASVMPHVAGQTEASMRGGDNCNYNRTTATNPALKCPGNCSGTTYATLTGHGDANVKWTLTIKDDGTPCGTSPVTCKTYTNQVE